jgi:iron complex outermembrane receptor protein
MRSLALIALCFVFALCVNAQTSLDTVRVLEEVQVSAFGYETALNKVPAAVALLNSQQLTRFANTSLLPVVNTIPGVRMEERSPGSFRFSIRGSSLRSPFGVRNVKFYWRGLPLTDGGGNTYLNLVDFNSVGSMEIVKGPGASLYGAGTGGVVLLEAPSPTTNRSVDITTLAGSYGEQKLNLSGTLISNENTTLGFHFGYQKANGYREQTEMNRVIGQLNLDHQVNAKATVSATILSSRLYYQTPGGLTEAQYLADPRQARPGTATTPGAVDQKAAVTNFTNYGGISFQYDWDQHWSSFIGVYSGVTDFENPTIRNYETRAEKNAGLRTLTTYRFKGSQWQGKFTVGAELQWFGSILKVNGNSGGQKTALEISNDDLAASQQLYYSQVDFDLPYQFFVTLGASVNALTYTDLNRLQDGRQLKRNFDPEFSPRVAILKKINSEVSLYGNISRGFSTPTFAEAVPSSGGFNRSLNAESGVSYELGIRGKMARHFSFEVASYWFNLKDAIVIQRLADGADYFVNAGSTQQNGLEGTLTYEIRPASGFVKGVNIWSSLTINNYEFKKYTQAGQDFSGNSLTGIPPQVAVFGFDLRLKSGLYVNATSFYTDKIPLNDGNTAFASSYWSVGAKVGYNGRWGRVPIEPFAGINNALNETYSLGNDLNAVGGRYYNAAAPRNYFLGIRLLLGQGRQ